MLIKALISRLNDGTNTSSSAVSSSHRRLSTLVYDKYPNLPSLILRLLKQGDTIGIEAGLAAATMLDQDTLRAQRVFPALEMIEQSGVPKQHQLEIRRALQSHLEGPIWAIRDKSAKALSYLPATKAVLLEVQHQLQADSGKQNVLHGRLLYARYLVMRVRHEPQGTSYDVEVHQSVLLIDMFQIH